MTREIETREIEFRAWLKKDKVMTGKVLQITDNPSVQYIKFDKIENWEGNHLNNPTFADLRDVVLMQYTGLKDKNGKKIFEGDIVKSSDNDEFIINFKYGSFGASWIKDNLVWYSSATNSFNEKNFEVIGNIYEKYYFLFY